MPKINVQLIVNGMTLEIGVYAARIVVVDGNEDLERLDKKLLMEEWNVMDVQLKLKLVTPTIVHEIVNGDHTQNGASAAKHVTEVPKIERECCNKPL